MIPTIGASACPATCCFTVLLQHYGISPNMNFRFSGMVGDGVVLQLEESPGGAYELRDATGRPICMSIAAVTSHVTAS
jgi:hypothetical protein